MLFITQVLAQSVIATVGGAYIELAIREKLVQDRTGQQLALDRARIVASVFVGLITVLLKRLINWVYEYCQSQQGFHCGSLAFCQSALFSHVPKAVYANASQQSSFDNKIRS